MEQATLSHEELKEICKDLAMKIKDQFAPDIIVAITKGGLIPSYYIADALGVKTVETVNLSSYEGQSQKQINDNNLIKKDFKNFNVLIVDDLVDSGKTLEWLINSGMFDVEKTKTAVIYYKEKSFFIPDFYYKKVGEEWIVFPYE